MLLLQGCGGRGRCPGYGC